MKAPADGAGLASSRMVAGSCLRRIAAGFARHKSKRLIVVAVGVALVLAIVSGARIGEYLQRRAARQRSRNAKVWRVAARDACVVRALLADGEREGMCARGRAGARVDARERMRWRPRRPAPAAGRCCRSTRCHARLPGPQVLHTGGPQQLCCTSLPTDTHSRIHKYTPHTHIHTHTHTHTYTHTHTAPQGPGSAAAVRHRRGPV